MNDDLGATSGRRGTWKWWVCGLLLLATMILYMDRLVLTQQEALIRTAFGIEYDDFAYGLLDSAFSVAFACGALLAGWLADRWSVWLLYPLAVALWSMTGVVTGLITGYWILFTCRFFLGFFESGHWPCALKTTQRILGPTQRTMGNGILQSGAAIGSILTPLGLWLAGPSTSWRLPFLCVGFLGLCWTIGWFCLVRRHEVDRQSSPAPPRTEGGVSWLEIYRDRRFWIMVVVVTCINSTWHFFRVWMPVILRRLYDFSRDDVQEFSIVYYVAADLGSLASGYFALTLVRRGFSVHGSRLAGFGICAVLVLLSLTAIVAPGQQVFLWVLPVVAFASLGLFPPYYSFTQELSVRDQGKVTGSLSFICWMVMAGLRALEGFVSDQVKARGGEVVDQYAFGIVLAGIMPLVGLSVLVLFWRQEGHSAG
jgi:ACS family hexuronate transporter-like MFS transporter